MKTRKKKIKKSLLAFALCLLTVGAGAIPALSQPFNASADIIVSDYFATAIESDLEDIDVNAYPADAEGTPQVIRFQEFCYSEKPFYADAYGVYIYVYNPTQKKISASMCKANMAVEYNASGEPTRYDNVSLTYLDEAYDYRFLKFCVSSPEDFLMRAQEQMVAREERRYDVAGVQLYFTDGKKSVDTGVKNTYIWTGYANGLGGENALKLECQPLKTLSLEVHPTYYRPTVAGETVKKQQSLHSVYFSIPNDTMEEYGALYGVEAQFLNAVLKPMLYIEDENAYTTLQPYLGQTLNGHTEALPYQIAGGLVEVADPIYSPIFSYAHSADLTYNYDGDMLYMYKDNIYESDGSGLWNDLTIWNKYETKRELATLYLLFHGADATNRIVSSEVIKKAMEASADDFGGTLIQGAEAEYSEKIFSSVDKEYTTLEKTADDSLSLEAEIVTQDWYEKLWGLGGSGVDVETIYSNLQCVYRVKDTDITGNVANDCAKLCIAPADYADFCQEYERAKGAGETLYLFRYQVSDYTAYTATIMGETTSQYLGNEVWCAENTPQGYFFSQTVNLDFDIIDVTLKDEDGATVLGVVANPTDIVPDGTPPQDPNYKPPEENGCNAGLPWWGWLLIVLGALAFVFFVKPVLSLCTTIIKGAGTFLKWLLKGLWYIIASPYYLVRWIVRLIRGDDKW